MNFSDFSRKAAWIVSCVAMVFAAAPSRGASVVDVASFGAEPGSSDSAATRIAFQSALDVAKTNGTALVVRVGPGTYLLDRTLHIYSNTKLSLDENAVLVRRDSIDKTMLMGMHLASDGSKCLREASCSHGGYSQVRNVTIEGGVWDAAASAGENVGILHLCHGSNIVVRAGVFKHATNHAINMSATCDSLVSSCTFSDQVRYTGTDPDFWGDIPVGDDSRFPAIETIHLDSATHVGETGNYPEDGTPCVGAVVKDCVFANVFAGAGNHHEYSAAASRPRGLDVTGCRFSGLLGAAVMAFGFDGVNVADNQFYAGARLVQGDGSTGVDILRNSASSAANQAIALRRCEGSRIFSNDLEYTKEHAVAIDGGSAKVADNDIDETGQFGIYAYGGATLSASGNTIRSAGSNGIAAESSVLVAQDNLIDGAKGAGIYLADAPGSSVTICTVVGPASHGIVAQRSNAVRLTGNSVQNSVGNGILFMECDRAEASDNWVQGSGGHAFCCSGGSATLTDNIAYETEQNGVYVAGGAAVTATRTIVSDAKMHGMCLLGAGTTEIADGSIYSAAKCGVCIVETSDAKVCGMQIRDPGENGVKIDKSSSVSVACSLLVGTSDHAFLVTDSEGCIFDGNLVEAAGKCGLYAKSSASQTIARNRILEPDQNALVLDGCTGSAVLTNELVSSGAYGIAVSGGDASLVGNAIVDPETFGVFAKEAEGLRIVGNKVGGSGSTGLALMSCTSAEVAYNVVTNAGAHGITCNGGSATLAGNTVSGTAKDGFYVENGAEVRIEDNTLYELGQRGICINSARADVLWNMMWDVATMGVLLDTADGSTVQGNQMSSVSGPGVQVSSTKDAVIAENVVSSDKKGIFVNGKTGGIPASATVVSNVVESATDYDIYFGPACDAGEMNCNVSLGKTGCGVSSASSNYITVGNPIPLDSSATLLKCGGTGGDDWIDPDGPAALGQIAVPTRDGCVFEGYCMKPCGAGEMIVAADGTYLGDRTSLEQVRFLFAVWSPSDGAARTQEDFICLVPWGGSGGSETSSMPNTCSRFLTTRRVWNSNSA